MPLPEPPRDARWPAALLALAALLHVLPAGAQYPGPLERVTFGPSSSLVVGPVDADGFEDLVAIDADPPFIHYFQGRREGGLVGPVTLGLGGRLADAILVDLDGDGDQEFLCADEEGGGIQLLDTRGATPPSFNVDRVYGEDEATGLVATDLDGDGDPDVLAVLRGADRLQRWWNVGGQLVAGTPVEVGDGPVSACVLPHPAGPLLVVVHQGVLSREWQVFDLPSLELRQRIPGVMPQWAAPADLDGDPWPDLLLLDGDGQLRRFAGDAGRGLVEVAPIAVEPGSRVVVDHGNPQQGLRYLVLESRFHRVVQYDDSGQARGSWYTGEGCRRMVRSDPDGDGAPSLFLPLPFEERVLEFRPRGEGFDGQPAIKVGGVPLRAAWEGASPEGPAQLALVSPNPAQLTILERDGASLRVEGQYPVPAGSSVPAGADVDGDGRRDWFVSTEGTVELLRAQVGGGYARTTVLGGRRPGEALVAGDLDADGNADLVVGDRALPGFLLLRGDGAGNFALSDTLDSRGQSPIRIRLHDLDGDGRPDIVATLDVDRLMVHYNDTAAPGPPVFEVNYSWTVGDKPVGFGFAQLNADTVPDIVVGNSGDSSYSVLKSVFTRIHGLSVSSEPSPGGTGLVIVDDTNGDAVPDLVLGGGSPQVALHANTGGGNFSVPSRVRGAVLLSGMAASDLDGDAVADLMLLDPLGAVVVLLHSGDGGVVAPAPPVASASRDGQVARLRVDGPQHPRPAWVMEREGDQRRFRLLPVAPGRWEAQDPSPPPGEVRYTLRGPDAIGVQPATLPAMLATGTVRGGPLSLRAERGSGGSVQIVVEGATGGRPRGQLLDLRGRRLLGLQFTGEGGRWTARWSGRDAAGRRVARGRYHVVVEVGGERLGLPVLLPNAVSP